MTPVVNKKPRLNIFEDSQPDEVLQKCVKKLKMLGQSSKIPLDVKVESWGGSGSTGNEKPPQKIVKKIV